MPAGRYEAGTVYVQVVPSLQGWHESILDQLRREVGKGVPVQVAPVVDGEDVQKSLDKATKKAKATITPTVVVDPKQVKKQAERAAGHFAGIFTSRMQSALRAMPDIKIKADTSDVDRALATIRETVGSLSKVKIDVDMDEHEVLAALKELEEQAKRLDRTAVTIEARTNASQTARELGALFRTMYAASNDAKTEIADLKEQIEEIGRVHATLDMDTAEATRRLDGIQVRLEELQRDTTSIDIDATIGGVLTKLATVQGAVNHLDGQTANVEVKVKSDKGFDIPFPHTRFQRLAALSVAGAGALGGLGAAFLVAAAGAVTFGAAVATAAVGMVDIGKAMKAQTDASRQAGQTAAQEAAQRLVAANQVLSAQESLADAHANVGRAAREASTGVRTALAAQARAEQDLSRAQVDALRAQEDLTEARRDAERSLQDVNLRVTADALAQRQAILDVQAAQEGLNETLADPAATERQRAEAQLTLEQAQQRLAEVSLAYQRAQVDAQAANAAGVDGAEQVVDAQDGLVQAHQRVRDAELASQEAAERVTEARISGAESVAQAQQQAIAAQRSLADAQARANVQAQDQGTAQEKLAEAWDKLTPASKRLISELRAQSGQWDVLRRSTQGFVPGLSEALQTLAPHMGQLSTNVGTLSGAFGGFLSTVAEGLVDAEPLFTMIANSSRTLFPLFGESVTKAMQAVGGLVVELQPLAPQLFDVADAASDLLTSWTPFIASASGPLLDGLETMLGHLKVLGPLLDAIAKPAADLTTALTGGLSRGLQNLVDGGLGAFLQRLVDLVAVAAPLLEHLGTISGALARGLTPALEVAADVLKPIVDLVGVLAEVIDKIPVPLLAVASGFLLLQKFGGGIGKGIEKVSTGLGKLGESATLAGYGMGYSEKSSDRVGGAFGRMAKGVSAVGSRLPVIGLGFMAFSAVLDMVQEDADEAAKEIDTLAMALIRGGDAQAAAEAKWSGERTKGNEELDKLNRNVRTYATARAEAKKTLEEGSEEERKAIERAQKLREELGPVGVAQERVNEAQKNYTKAVADHSKASPQAAEALYRWKLETLGLGRAQREAAEETKSHTQRMLEQQDNILAAADAATRFRQAGQNLRQGELRIAEARARATEDQEAQAAAQTEYNNALKQFKKGSPEVLAAQRNLAEATRQAESSALSITSAQDEMTSAQSRYVASAGEAAAASAKASGATNTDKDALKAKDQALIDLVRTYGASLDPAMLTMVSRVGEAAAAANGLQVEIDETGQTILRLPGVPPIVFTSNIKQFNQELLDEAKKWELLAEKFAKGTAGIFSGFVGTVASDLASMMEQAARLGPGKPKGKAHGGLIGGSGTGDTVPAMLTPGEFVFSRPAVANLGLSTVAALHSQAVAGFATGGLVGPVRMQAGGPVPTTAGGSGGSGEVELVDVAALTATLTEMTTAAEPATDAIRDGLVPALMRLASESTTSAGTVVRDWQAITATIGGAVAVITTSYLASLRTGLSQVDVAMATTARGFALGWQAVARSAADPVRWMLANPFTALINAWNVIDAAFAVGRPLAPIPVTFAAGGPVAGGTPGEDSVLALLMPGEFVAPVPMVNQIGMNNLEAARRSVLGGGSAEGVIPGYEQGGAVTKALSYAQAQVGKPYIWGGVGPAGFDCSGILSAVSNVALGQPPHRRRFTTAAFSRGRGAGGFVPGTGSTFVIGVSGAHMAGNLAGANIESTTKNGISGVRVGGDAASPLDAQFTKGQFFLPQLGGTFIPAPSGAAFTIDSLLQSTFAEVRGAIAALAPQFGANTMAAGASAEMTAMLNAVTGWASANLSGPVTGGGTGPVAEQVRAVAARYGWGEGPQWAALSNLITRESGWNPTAHNPSSTAYGLGQLLDGTWAGTGIGKTSDPALQAEAMLRYISGRYRDPAGAWSFWQGHRWYDQGGMLPPGISLAHNGTGRPEPVLSPRQWQAMAGQGAPGRGEFTGELYLDSGQFLGVVRGEIGAAHEATARSIVRRTRP